MRPAFPARHASGALAALAVVGLGLLAGLAAAAQRRVCRTRSSRPRATPRPRARRFRAIYALLSAEAQRDYGLQGTRRLVEQAKAELSRQGAALLSPASRVQASAEIRFEDGESALFDLEDGAFHLSSLGTVPSRPGALLRPWATLGAHWLGAVIRRCSAFFLRKRARPWKAI
jgi:hypothetical protein